MKTLKYHFKSSKNFKIFIKKYIDYLKDSLNELDVSSLDLIRKELEIVKKKNKTIFVFGNGGAAATTITMANDLGFDIMKKSKSTTAVLSYPCNRGKNSNLMCCCGPTGVREILKIWVWKTLVSN